MKRVQVLLYLFFQWTWGIIQNVLGGLLFLICLGCKHSFFNGAVVTIWSKPYNLGCGMFIFLSDFGTGKFNYPQFTKAQYDMLIHEYGHTIQSIILGPLFLPVIGLPSFVWASFFQGWRARKHVAYYWLYCEKWANVLGDGIFRNVRQH